MLATIVSGWLVFEALDRILGGDLDELINRSLSLTRSAERLAEDEAFFDGLDVHVPSSAIILFVVAALLYGLVYLLTQVALLRLFVAHCNGVSLTAEEACYSVVRRTVRCFGYMLALGVPLALGCSLGVLVIVRAPALLLLLAPTTILIGIWLMPFMALFVPTIAAAPVESPVIQTVRQLVRGRWGYLVRCLIITASPAAMLGLATNHITQSALFVHGVSGYVVMWATLGALQLLTQAAGASLMYDAAGGPTDHELSGE